MLGVLMSTLGDSPSVLISLPLQLQTTSHLPIPFQASTAALVSYMFSAFQQCSPFCTHSRLVHVNHIIVQFLTTSEITWCCFFFIWTRIVV